MEVGGGDKWAKVKAAQSCQTLCNPMDYIVHRLLQARILEWVAFMLWWVRCFFRHNAIANLTTTEQNKHYFCMHWKTRNSCDPFYCTVPFTAEVQNRSCIISRTTRWGDKECLKIKYYSQLDCFPHCFVFSSLFSFPHQYQVKF